MSFGQNLQFLRKMQNKMTQDELAERLGVSRQTVSKWELDSAYPEMDKLIELCDLFSCSMDELVRGDMNLSDEAFSDIRFETVEPFNFVKYAVVSAEPEDDAIQHAERWAKTLGIAEPKIIGWDWPYLSQEQVNVHNQHGYEAALVIPDGVDVSPIGAEVHRQERQKYAVITIRFPMTAPFQLIPNAYKTLMTYMHMNGIEHHHEKYVVDCFEYSYYIDGVEYMDVYIAAE